MQRLDPNRTTWHITFGTFGTRLHGSERPTVDRKHSRFGEPFIATDAARERWQRQHMTGKPVRLTHEQRTEVEAALPRICERGEWTLRTYAADADHVHVLCDADRSVHGRQIRMLLKRWLTQTLDEKWPRTAGRSWWADGGSNKAVKEQAYLNNAYRYIAKQRATKPDGL